MRECNCLCLFLCMNNLEVFFVHVFSLHIWTKFETVSFSHDFQDRSLRVTHNLAVFGGCGLLLSIITGLFGINVDGIPGASNTPYAFGLFAAILFFIGVVLIALGLLYLGLKRPITEEQVEVRKLELKEMVKMFQHEAETHAQVRKKVSRHNLPPTAGDRFRDEAEYVLIR